MAKIAAKGAGADGLRQMAQAHGRFCAVEATDCGHYVAKSQRQLRAGWQAVTDSTITAVKEAHARSDRDPGTFAS